MSSQSFRKMDKKRAQDSDNESGQTVDCYGMEKKLHKYLETLNGQPEVLNHVEIDHSYSLPWNYRPDNCFAKPAKRLFWGNNRQNSVSWGAPVDNIDPLEIGKDNIPAYDLPKARQTMNETSRLVSVLRADPGDPDWENKIDKNDWSYSQGRIFDKVVKILHLEKLARLTYKSNWNEPVLRRVALDKSARRFRTTMAAIMWKPKVIQWLHNFLLETLDMDYLICYIDILQTLNKKIPSLIERMISGPTSNKINHDALNLLLKKPWDPASTGLTCSKPIRLPGNPLFVIVPYGSCGGADTSQRVQRWLPYLSLIGNVIPVNTNSSNKITVLTSLEHMMSATRAKLAELRSDYMGRPIILFGLNSGAALACQVALLEQVSAVICLGFPVNTVEDKRGQPDDNLLNLNTPVLFVAGQHGATAYIDDLEEIREKLRVETGLVIVSGADDQLRITKAKQRADGITQGMVDRCIIDEVTDFVGHILSSPQQTSSSQLNDNRPRFRLVEKKRKISIQDDLYPRRQYVTTSRRGLGRGRGRGRYVAQSTNVGIAISRRGGMLEKGITRPSIENISVINTSALDHSALSGESTSFKILPHIKVLGSEDFPTSKIDGTDNSFVDQLTPDRLLEMPVIIAPDTQEEHHNSGQLKGVY